MKVVISDFPKVLERNLEYEKRILQDRLIDCEVVIYPYRGDREEFQSVLENADALMTAFLPVDGQLMDVCKQLKCISYNATGYDTTDYKEAVDRKIAILHVEEYCTQEVAEHTMALILALSRGLKYYGHDVEDNLNWQYHCEPELRRISGQTIGIFGYGRIGKAVAKSAKAFGMRVLVCAHHLTLQEAAQDGVELVTADEIFVQADVITNHMSQTSRNVHFFNREAFSKMKRKPVFINVSRGSSVDENALEEALDQELLYAAGLDVLQEEQPELEKCGLLHRDNVIITPHAAFFSETSMEALQKISCENVVHYLRGEYEQIKAIVNKEIFA